MLLSVETIYQSEKIVKFRYLKMVLLCALLSLPALAQAYEIRTRDLYTSAPETHPNYLAMHLESAPIAQVRQELEKKEKIKLKDRGEAHVTVITPPEFEILKKNLSMEDINQIAALEKIQEADLKVRCLGRGQTADKLQTYFLVLESKTLLKIRAEIEKAWKKKGGSGDFKAEHFYPHVTLGFTHRDLHEQDGVIKDERSCISQVSAR
jgi:2'-5' RNA ligase